MDSKNKLDKIRSLAELKAKLRKGESIDERDEKGFTFLEKSIFLDHLELFAFCIKQGANIELPNLDGTRVLHKAILLGRDYMAIRLIKNEGADVNAQTYYDLTALICAVFKRNVKLAEILLDNGADASVKTTLQYHNGNTALHIAVKQRDVEMVKLFVSKNVGLDDENYIGETPLKAAEAIKEFIAVDPLRIEEDKNIIEIINILKQGNKNV